MHPQSAGALVPPSFFESSTASSLSQTISRLKSIVISDDASPGVHAFTVLARILDDPELGNMVDKEEMGMYSETVEKFGDALIKYVKDWHVDASNPQAVLRKMEELMWTNVLIYGVGGWKPEKDFNADFFQ